MHYSNDCRRGLLTKAALGTYCYQDGTDGGAAVADRAVDRMEAMERFDRSYV